MTYYILWSIKRYAKSETKYFYSRKCMVSTLNTWSSKSWILFLFKFWISFYFARKGYNFPFKLFNWKESPLHVILNFGSFHLFRSIPLNLIWYDDFDQYVNEKKKKKISKLFFITSLTYNILLLLSFNNMFFLFNLLTYYIIFFLHQYIHTYIYIYIYILSFFCMDIYILYSYMTCIHYVMMILRIHIIWFWMNNLILYNIYYVMQTSNIFLSYLISLSSYLILWVSLCVRINF